MSRMTFNQWLDTKPEFDCECIVICACFAENQAHTEINSYLIVKITSGEEGWYWGWCYMDGEEVDDLGEMTADQYFVIEMPEKK